MSKITTVICFIITVFTSIGIVIGAMSLLDRWAITIATKEEYKVVLSPIFQQLGIERVTCDSYLEPTQWIAEDEPAENEVWQCNWSSKDGRGGRLLIQLVEDFAFEPPILKNKNGKKEK